MASLERNWPSQPIVAAEAKCVYVYTGFENWKNQKNEKNEKMEKNECISVSGAALEEKIITPEAAQVLVAESHIKTVKEKLEVKLLPGEKHGWWSSNLPDKRFRARALVSGAINDSPSTILMDIGANISIINVSLAKRLVKATDIRTDKVLKIQGLSQKAGTSQRAEVKITLGWRVAYLFEVWIGEQTGGYDAILGTDFMMCAGIVLDMNRGRMRLPDEVVIPLTHRPIRDIGRTWEQKEVKFNKEVTIAPLERKDLAIQIKSIPAFTLWVTDYGGVFPTVIHDRKGSVRSIELSNVNRKSVSIPAQFSVALWVSDGYLPDKEGFVRVGSHKYEEWQKLVYERTSPVEIDYRYDVQAAAMEAENSTALRKGRPVYLDPPQILPRKPPELPARSSRLVEPADVSIPTGQSDVGVNLTEEEWKRAEIFIASSVNECLVDLRLEPEVFVHEAQPLHVEDLAHDLSLIPELPADDDLKPVNIEDKTFGTDGDPPIEQQLRMKRIVEKKLHKFIDSSNAAPPPVKGVLCDIDVQGARPIAQRARRVKPEHLEKLHKLLSDLLKHKLIKFSNSEWASPIVIVLKKDGINIRLCIDYRQVNSLTKLIHAAMPLIDDLLLHFEAVMWM